MNQTIDSTYIHAILKMAYAQLMVDCNGPYRTIIAVKFGPDVTLDEGTDKVGELVRRLQTQLRDLTRTEEFPSIRGFLPELQESFKEAVVAVDRLPSIKSTFLLSCRLA